MSFRVNDEFASDLSLGDDFLGTSFCNMVSHIAFILAVTTLSTPNKETCSTDKRTTVLQGVSLFRVSIYFES